MSLWFMHIYYSDIYDLCKEANVIVCEYLIFSRATMKSC